MIKCSQVDILALGRLGLIARGHGMPGSETDIKVNTEVIGQFEQLVIKIHDDLYRFIYSIANSRVVAEDALQNCLLAAFRNFGSLTDIGKFKPWMFTIAKREAFALLRKGQREIPGSGVLIDMHTDVKEASVDDGPAAASYGDPEEMLLRNEQKQKVLDALNSLDEEMRRVMNLRYFNGLSFREIAQVMRINENTARVWHLRAKKQIAKRIGSEQV